MPDDIVSNTLIGSNQKTFDPSYISSRPEDVLDRNKQYTKGNLQSFQTNLSNNDELQFQKWIKQNPNIPFDDSKTSDYDMRGFWKGLKDKDPTAVTSINPNDNMPHFPDTYKTPYHVSFSNESKYSNNKAPSWNDKDQLIDMNGNVVFDERAKVLSKTPLSVQLMNAINMKNK